MHYKKGEIECFNCFSVKICSGPLRIEPQVPVTFTDICGGFVKIYKNLTIGPVA